MFNIEGGCYAKAIDLTPETEPDIFQALRFGAVLENVVLDDEDRIGRFHDMSITENTRGAYPIDFIRNAKIPCVAGHPTDVIFLTCDAFGVLPPVSSLDAGACHVSLHQRLHGQGGRHRGRRDRAAGHVLALLRRAVHGLASDEIRRTAGRENAQHNARVWLVNTGWSGGSYGVGKRIKLAHTRALLDAIHAGALPEPRRSAIRCSASSVIRCPGVPAEILLPRDTWADKAPTTRPPGILPGSLSTTSRNTKMARARK